MLSLGVSDARRAVRSATIVLSCEKALLPLAHMNYRYIYLHHSEIFTFCANLVGNFHLLRQSFSSYVQM